MSSAGMGGGFVQGSLLNTPQLSMKRQRSDSGSMSTSKRQRLDSGAMLASIRDESANMRQTVVGALPSPGSMNFTAMGLGGSSFGGKVPVHQSYVVDMRATGTSFPVGFPLIIAPDRLGTGRSITKGDFVFIVDNKIRKDTGGQMAANIAGVNSLLRSSHEHKIKENLKGTDGVADMGPGLADFLETTEQSWFVDNLEVFQQKFKPGGVVESITQHAGLHNQRKSHIGIEGEVNMANIFGHVRNGDHIGLAVVKCTLGQEAHYDPAGNVINEFPTQDTFLQVVPVAVNHKKGRYPNLYPSEPFDKDLTLAEKLSVIEKMKKAPERAKFESAVRDHIGYWDGKRYREGYYIHLGEITNVKGNIPSDKEIKRALINPKAYQQLLARQTVTVQLAPPTVLTTYMASGIVYEA